MGWDWFSCVYGGMKCGCEGHICVVRGCMCVMGSVGLVCV